MFFPSTGRRKSAMACTSCFLYWCKVSIQKSGHNMIRARSHLLTKRMDDFLCFVWTSSGVKYLRPQLNPPDQGKFPHQKRLMRHDEMIFRWDLAIWGKTFLGCSLRQGPELQAVWAHTSCISPLLRCTTVAWIPLKLISWGGLVPIFREWNSAPEDGNCGVQ